MKEVVVIEEVKDIQEFLDFTEKHYENHPYFALPLKQSQLDFFNTENPLWKIVLKKLFVAKKNGEIVGRIATFIDKKYQKKESVGYFGFFECIQDTQVALNLVKTCEKHLKKHNIKTLRGPINASILNESGILIENFEHIPSPTMNYNHPYYSALLENCGLRKCRDLLSFSIDLSSLQPTHKEREDVEVRKIRKRDFRDELHTAANIINKGFENHFQFCAHPTDVFAYQGKSLKHLLDYELSFFLTHKKTTKDIGVVICYPNYNQILKDFKGKLGFLNTLKFLLKKRKISEAKLNTISLLPSHIGKGFGFHMVSHVIDQLKRKNFTKLDYSWVDEQNIPSVKLAEKFGGRIDKRYRLFEKSI